ncbi:hypothetical protein A2704_00555 [Candidatus Kaiserbacteria bacterium RIFCSPHIGHO2_01_FULL_54_36b]|uniref:Uncharacterized protein n=1 Tax=Candidatus Kaiserbacteria bacterium RIFCSPHIGHO2_01_FULL_54_36b TaxID=1798483 RepID=A0A1F6CT11_9BACT|nr:MAG: hypothetical protein A2704_00555 [Candidatus Kaiserbacteria bacterium RIFCSPHIGHO2_01_FULL_54_36b]
MPDKMKPYRAAKEETGTDSAEQAFVPTAAEENVLLAMHSRTDGRRGEKVPRDNALLGMLHDGVESCECYPLFKKYASGEIPSLERMFGNMQPLLDELKRSVDAEAARVAQGEPDDILKEEKSIYGLLAGREQQVRGAIQRYVTSVIRFKNLQRISAGGARDVSEQFVEADHARRRAHETLIEALRVYTAQVKLALENGYADSYKHFNFEFWRPGTDARDASTKNSLVFAPEVLGNRDFIRDWAIVADFVNQLQVLGDEEYINSMRDRLS